MSRYFDTPKPRLFAHRGASGAFPENTMPAFRAGISAGASHLELDVHATKDGRIVVLHDPDLSRTTGVHRLVREVDYGDLVGMDAGANFRDASGRACHAGQHIRVPTLDEVIGEFPDVPLNIEIKQDDPPIEDAVIELLRKHHAVDRVLLAAEHQPLMDRIRCRYTGPTGFTAEEVFDFHERVSSERWENFRPAGRALQVPPTFENIDVVTEAFVAAAHEFEIEVHVWTINDAPSIAALLRMGVDGIMSDLPEMAARVIVGA